MFYNSGLESIATKLKILYWNVPYKATNDPTIERTTDIFPQEVYPKIGRHVSILVRYLENFDALFRVDAFPEWLQDTIVNNLLDVVTLPDEDVKVDFKIIDENVRTTILEFKWWYKWMNDTIKKITDK